MKLILVIGLLFGAFISTANLVSVNFVDANATVANGRAMTAGYHATGLWLRSYQLDQYIRRHK